MRTGPDEASVFGVAGTAGDIVELFVDGTRIAQVTPVSNLDYWFLHVPVSDGSAVQTRIGSLVTPARTVPPYTPRPVPPPGFIYARGTQLMLNGTPLRLFGVNEQTTFVHALIASGLYGWANPDRYWGRNELFPAGPGSTIANVSSPDDLWREFFRYFLHYQRSSSEPFSPRLNLLRIWIVDENFGLEKAYRAWSDHPAEFWRIFDRLVYWADCAGVYLVPVLGHMDRGLDNRMYDTTSALYARHVQLVRAVLARYNDNPRIAMWDLWNEADVNNDAYWAGAGGIDGYRAWAATYLADVKPYAANHLLTLGTGGWTLFPGVPAFGWRYYVFWNDIPGLDVSSHHGYATAEDGYLIDWRTAWHEALGIPHFEGEYGYNLYPGPSGLGYGYWPWFTNRTRAYGWPAISPMVLVDNGRGAYADYPYNGTLPEYPSGAPLPEDLPPVAAFEVTPSAPMVEQQVTIDASISSDDFGIARYEWAFGDHVVAEGENVIHTFHAAGEFPVTLTVTDTSGRRDTQVLVVRVASAVVPESLLSAPSVWPWFAAGLLCAIAPLATLFSGRRPDRRPRRRSPS